MVSRWQNDLLLSQYGETRVVRPVARGQQWDAGAKARATGPVHRLGGALRYLFTREGRVGSFSGRQARALAGGDPLKRLIRTRNTPYYLVLRLATLATLPSVCESAGHSRYPICSTRRKGSASQCR